MASNIKDVTSVQTQEQLLKAAEKTVEAEAFYMKRAFDPPVKVTEGLKHASNMVAQLRTSLLTPTNYYKLYLMVFVELQFLESHLLDEKSKGEKISRLYEIVQYAGNILPRLYLLITVGSAYIKSKEAPPKDILHDLVEMAKGVQHPLRGLFLRFYLSDLTKDKLPDSGSLDGDVTDSIDFVINNFTEMNKMWVRMQPPKGSVRNRAAREQERLDLRQVVAKNLSILAQLEGCTQKLYASSVLGRLLEQIVSCQDRIAQQSLMESLIQVFPDEYHLATLNTLLDSCSRLTEEVDVKEIVIGLFDRLISFAKKNQHTMSEISFDLIFSSLTNLITNRPAFRIHEVLELLASLMELSIAFFPQAPENVDAILQVAGTTMHANYADVKCTDRQQIRQVHRMLMQPLSIFSNVIQVFNLANYSPLISYLNFSTRKLIATDFASKAIENEVSIANVGDVERLLEFIGPLVRDEPDQPSDDQIDLEDFEQDQNLVASLIHLFAAPSSSELFALYVAAKKIFMAGDPKRTRIRYTFVPLTFAVLALTRRMKAELSSEPDFEETWIKRGRVLFRFVHEAITTLAAHAPDLALKLFLQAAQSASHAGFATIAYEFLSQAFLLYEGEIYEAKNQVRTIHLIISTLQTLHCFSQVDYDTLITKAALLSSKLLIKQDQCQSVLLCSHLFWVGDGENDYRDGKRVLECLQRCLRITDQVTEPQANISLFIEILNAYLYHFSHGNSSITVVFLNNLIELINTNIGALKPADEQINSYYHQTLQYIRSKQSKHESWRDIKLEP